MRALVSGTYDTAAFQTFSKVPSQFLADGRLRAIWTVLANIGEGWAPLPVDTLIRAAELVDIVHLLGRATVIGGDLVEVTHAWDPSGRTGITASWVIREALLAWWGT